jgi:hypothetical protein
MKVVLTAFAGKLKSEPMDWPEENLGQDIHLILDMERPSFKRDDRAINLYELEPRRCKFEFTNSYSMSPGEPAIYKLVEIR